MLQTVSAKGDVQNKMNEICLHREPKDKLDDGAKGGEKAGLHGVADEAPDDARGIVEGALGAAFGEL